MSLKIYTQNFWIPAINNDGRFGKWAFVEVMEPWYTSVKELIISMPN